jgi:hypothetical protein
MPGVVRNIFDDLPTTASSCVVLHLALVKYYCKTPPRSPFRPAVKALPLQNFASVLRDTTAGWRASVVSLVSPEDAIPVTGHMYTGHI